MKKSLRLVAVAAAVAVGVLPGASNAAPASTGQVIDISSLRNSQCITPQYVTFLSCNYDAYRSFVSESLPAAGPVNVKGTVFDFPARGLYGTADTVLTEGQVITLPKPVSGFKGLAALMEQYNGKSKESFTVTYTDGTKSVLPYTTVEMNSPQAKSDIPGVVHQYISSALQPTFFGGEGAIGLVIVPLDSKKSVKSITLPGKPGARVALMQALSFSTLSAAPKPPKTGPIFN